ncbi:MAG: hypothetical protein LBT40_02985 [Deltaproteobacteria bacterium]|jgi:restriction endonuclease Mrr|nr:hypothetical protein [Deltaproteobacteria bacterium]
MTSSPIPHASSEDFLRPVLSLAGREERITEESVAAPLMSVLGLPPEFAEERVASGETTRLASWIRWSIVCLGHAGLVERVAKGAYAITEAGLGVLRSGPKRIGLRFLLRFPGFRKSCGTEAPPVPEDAPLAGSLRANLSGPPRPAGRGTKSRRGALSCNELFLPLLTAAGSSGLATREELQGPALELVRARRLAAGGESPDLERTKAVERFGTAIYYLRVAGLLKSPSRGRYLITEEGLETLARNPADLTFADIGVSASFRALYVSSREWKRIDRAYRELADGIVSETAARIRGMGREGFGRLASELALAMASRAGGEGTGSVTVFRILDGKDGPEVAEALAAFSLNRLERGQGEWILFTRGDLPPWSASVVRELPLGASVMDERAMAALMIELGVGTSVRNVFSAKEVNQDFFDILNV